MRSAQTTAATLVWTVKAATTGRSRALRVVRTCGKSSSHCGSISRTRSRERLPGGSLPRLPLFCVLIFCRLRGGPLMRAPKSLLAFLLVAMACAGQEPQDPKPLAPSSTSALPSEFASAELLLHQGKYDEAIAELQSLAAKNPAPKNLARELGAAYYQKGDYLKAAEYLKAAQPEDPKDSESIQLLGLSYYLAGHPADAIPYLEKVQSWFPRANVDAAYILGKCYIQTKDYPKARIAFARMFDVPADSAASYLFTARMLLRQEFDPVAEEYAQKAAALDPKLPLAHFLLGELYLYKSKVPEAITEFQKELAINPGHAAA